MRFMMNKAQMSFEYILLYSFVMIIFIVVGTILISGLEKTSKTQSETGYLAKQIKSSLIIASLSPSDFKTQIIIPQTISGISIYVDIYPSPDNLVIIRERDSGEYKTVAREFLPVINTGVKLENLTDCKIIISKEDKNISVKLAN